GLKNWYVVPAHRGQPRTRGSRRRMLVERSPPHVTRGRESNVLTQSSKRRGAPVDAAASAAPVDGRPGTRPRTDAAIASPQPARRAARGRARWLAAAARSVATAPAGIRQRR